MKHHILKDEAYLEMLFRS